MPASREESSVRRVVHRPGAQLSYGVRGDGPLLVLIQGLGLSSRAWLDLPERLAARGWRVLTPDNRGTGASLARGPRLRLAALRLATLADDVAALIEAEGAGQPAVVAGISLGGMIAQRVALRHPGVVRGLLLAATTCGLPYGRLAAPRTLWRLARACTVAPGSGCIDDLLFHAATIEERPQLVADWNRRLAAERFSAATMLSQLLAAALHAAGFSLGAIGVPTEVVTGDGDVLIPPSNARILADRIPAARLTVVPRGGHVFPLEHPDILPRLIERLA